MQHEVRTPIPPRGGPPPLGSASLRGGFAALRRWPRNAFVLTALLLLPLPGPPLAAEPLLEAPDAAPAAEPVPEAPDAAPAAEPVPEGSDAAPAAEPVLEAPDAAPAAPDGLEGLDAAAIARGADDVLRSSRTYMEATMTVLSPRLGKPRAVAFRSWDDRAGDRSFIRILSPAKDAGTGFLRLPPNLWTYVPRVERTMRIPPSMMLQPWMGSDFTNDDLVNESSAVEDYEHRLLRIDESPEGHEGLRAYVLEYIPREEAPVVWGKIVGWIAIEHSTPLRQDFYDEHGVKVRSMRFGDIREVDGRRVPHLWSMTPLEKKGHETRLQLERIDFDASFDDGIFTTRNLKKR